MSAAETFCRERIPTWEARGYVLSPSEVITLEGAYVLDYNQTLPDSNGRIGRPGGALPVIVDATTGSCRFVDGQEEYWALIEQSEEGH